MAYEDDDEWAEFSPEPAPSSAAPDEWAEFSPEPPPRRQMREPEPEAEGMLATAGRAFLHEAPAVVGGAMGAMYGAGLAAPIPVPGSSLAGGVAGAIAGGFGGAALADEGRHMFGLDDDVQLAVNAKANPWSAAIGQGAAQVLGFGAGSIGSAARTGVRAGLSADAISRGSGALIGGGLEAGSQAYQGEFDPARLATQTAAGGLFHKPYGWGEQIYGAGQKAGSRVAESYRGGAGPTSSAGQAEERLPPDKVDPGNTQEVGVGSEIDYSKPKPSATGDRAGVHVTDVDPDVMAAVRGPAAEPPPPAAESPPPAAEAPPPAAGSEDAIRYYHGGKDPGAGGGRWLTPDENYARDFRSNGEPNEVHYVDIPRSRLQGEGDLASGYDDINGYPRNFEAPEDVARQLQRLEPPPAAEAPPAAEPPPAAKKRAGKPVSLLQHLARNGGLEDTPDVREALSHDPKLIARIVRKDGRKLDDAWRDAAVDSRYINDPGARSTDQQPHTNMNDLLVMIREESSPNGRKHYPLGEEPPPSRRQQINDRQERVTRDIDDFLASDERAAAAVSDMPGIEARMRRHMSRGASPVQAFDRSVIAEEKALGAKGGALKKVDEAPPPPADELPPARDLPPSPDEPPFGVAPAREMPPSPDEPPFGAPARFEPGADGRDQAVIPGAERAPDAVMAQRGSDRALQAAVPQKSVESTGLFGDSMNQRDLLDMPPAKPAAEAPPTVSDDLKVKQAEKDVADKIGVLKSLHQQREMLVAQGKGSNAKAMKVFDKAFERLMGELDEAQARLADLNKQPAKRDFVEAAAEKHGGLEAASDALQARMARQVEDIEAGRVEVDPAQVGVVQRQPMARKKLDEVRAKKEKGTKGVKDDLDAKVAAANAGAPPPVREIDQSVTPTAGEVKVDTPAVKADVDPELVGVKPEHKGVVSAGGPDARRVGEFYYEGDHAKPGEWVVKRGKGEKGNTDPVVKEGFDKPGKALLEAGRQHRESLKTGAQPGANGAQPGANGAQTGAGGPPPPAGAPPSKPPPGQPPPRGPAPPPPSSLDKLSAAERMDDVLYRHTTEASARTVNYTNRVEEAKKIHPINEKIDQGNYRALEAEAEARILAAAGGKKWVTGEGEFEKLPAKQQQAYRHITDDIDNERVAAFKELKSRKGLTEEEELALNGYDDREYLHRVLKKTRGNEDYSTADPVSGYVGSRKESAEKAKAFKEGVAADGSRHVISHDGEGQYTLWDKGKRRSATGPEEFQNGQSFTVDGKDFTIVPGRTDNIELHARLDNGKAPEYYKSAIFSATDAHQQIMSRLDFLKIVDDFKVNPGLDPYRMQIGDSKKIPEGWVKSKIPDLDRFYMDPYMAAALDNNYQPGIGFDVPKIVEDFNRLATKSIFWNPVPHAMNAQVHHIVARGGDWFSTDPKIWKNFGKSIFEGWDAVFNKTPELERMLRSGAPMVMSGIDRQNWRENFGKMVDHDLRANPKKWEEVTRAAGFGKPIDAARYIYDGAQTLLWRYSDFLMASRIRELEMRGMTTEKAIKDAAVHMPDYRIPIKMFGSTWFPKIMSDKNISMFGRYHMGMMKSLIHMGTDAFGPKTSTEDRKKAFGNIAALVAMGAVVKPILDYMVQTVTGNKDAKMHARGPLAPITNWSEVYKGERSMGSAISNITTINPSVRLALDTLTNRDFAGRTIVEPGSSTPRKAVQAVEHVAKAAISPYATFGPTIQPGTTKSGPVNTLAQQLLDVKVPTTAEMKGKHYGLQKARKDALKREKKPRGLIEYVAP